MTAPGRGALVPAGDDAAVPPADRAQAVLTPEQAARERWADWRHLRPPSIDESDYPKRTHHA